MGRLLFLSLLLIACSKPSSHSIQCPIPKSKSVGIWYSTWYSLNANSPNFWTQWNIQYTPSLGRYDSADIDVVDRHITMMLDAGIDFVILDETNNLYVNDGFILRNAIVFKERAERTTLKFAVAIGGMQFSNNPATLDYEIGEVQRLFVNSPNYYTVNGKPLIVSYPHLSQTAEVLDFLSKQHPDIEVSWIHGKAQAGEMGWATPGGPIADCNVMNVMPGWNNKHGEFVGRNNGEFYKQSWNMTLNVNPSTIVISSFNDFAEETAIESTKEYGDIYWDMTVKYIHQYRGR